MPPRSSKSTEFEGSTVEDAIRKALCQLGVTRESINVKVVSEEQKGLFGMEGAKLAKIKVSLKRVHEISKENRERSDKS